MPLLDIIPISIAFWGKISFKSKYVLALSRFFIYSISLTNVIGGVGYKIKSKLIFEKYLFIAFRNWNSIKIVLIPFSIKLVFCILPVFTLRMTDPSSFISWVFLPSRLSVGDTIYTSCPFRINSRSKSVYPSLYLIDQYLPKLKNRTFILSSSVLWKVPNVFYLISETKQYIIFFQIIYFISYIEMI